MKKILLVLPILIFLSGCIGDQKGRQEITPPAAPTLPQVPAPPIINLPKAEIVDLSGLKADLRSEIQTSANNTQNQMSGLVNASVSKLSERITGVEASITTNATATATATADLRAKLESTINLTNKIQTELTIRNEINAKVETKIEAQVQLIKDLSLQVGKLESTVQGQGAVAASAQVGWNNKFEQLQQQITSTAGRDVNMLPREAVYLLLGIVSLICGLFSTGIYYAYRNARQREENTAKLLMKAVARLEPEHTRDLL